MKRNGGENEEDQEDMVIEGKGRKGGENEEKEVNNPHNITRIIPAPTKSKTTRPRDYARQEHEARDQNRHRNTKGRYTGTHRNIGTNIGQDAHGRRERACST